jgi:hypothetical protein
VRQVDNSNIEDFMIAVIDPISLMLMGSAVGAIAGAVRGAAKDSKDPVKGALKAQVLNLNNSTQKKRPKRAMLWAIVK